MAAVLGGTLTASAGAVVTTNAVSAKAAGGAVAKWLVVVLVGSTMAATAGVLIAQNSAPTAEMATPRTPTATATATAAVVPSADRVEHAPTPSALATATPVRSPPVATAAEPTASHAVRPGPPPSALPSPTPSAEDLAAEAALLEDARDAVARHDGAAALAVLNRHSKTFPRPALADEAFVLRVEAISTQGDHERVRALASPWLANHPTSPYAPRVRRVLALGQDRVAPSPEGSP
jgi:hypothetical protein